MVSLELHKESIIVLLLPLPFPHLPLLLLQHPLSGGVPCLCSFGLLTRPAIRHCHGQFKAAIFKRFYLAVDPAGDLLVFGLLVGEDETPGEEDTDCGEGVDVMEDEDEKEESPELLQPLDRSAASSAKRE